MKKYLVVFIIIVFAGSVGFLVLQNSADKPTATETRKKLYIALGDSIAAGVGLENPSDSSACDRTNQSYPSQVVTNKNIELQNIACSGASITAGIIGSQTVNGLALEPQLNQLIAQEKPDIITLTVGANDIGWSQILSNCYVSTCGTPIDNTTMDAKLQSLEQGLSTTFDKVSQTYPDNHPTFVVTGYYSVLPAEPALNCTELIGINTTEQTWIREFTVKLNSVIRTTAESYANVTYMPIDFTGHELCTTEPWIQGILDAKPYHPTANGQNAIANQLGDKIL